MKGLAVTLLLWVMATMSRAEAPRGDSLMHEVVQGNNQFAIDIYARLRQQPGNLFLSPYSLSTALAMTYAGARGETAEQMAKVLHFDVTPDRLHPAFEALIRQVNENKGRPYRLSVANALWGQEGDPFLPEFLRLLADRYGAGLRRVDFHFTEQARRTINAWVEEQTEGKIKDLLKPPNLLPGTSLVSDERHLLQGGLGQPVSEGGHDGRDLHGDGGRPGLRPHDAPGWTLQLPRRGRLSGVGVALRGRHPLDGRAPAQAGGRPDRV